MGSHRQASEGVETGRTGWLGVALAGLGAIAASACDLLHADASPAKASGTTGARVDPHEPDGSGVDRRVMRAYLACLDSCFAGVGADRPTCRLACASSSLDEVPDLSAGARACMLPCLEVLARCSENCETTPTPPEDEWACELQCQSAASSCLSHCVDDNA